MFSDKFTKDNKRQKPKDLMKKDNIIKPLEPDLKNGRKDKISSELEFDEFSQNPSLLLSYSKHSSQKDINEDIMFLAFCMSFKGKVMARDKGIHQGRAKEP